MSIENILEIARQEIGNKELPSGSNRTKYGRWYGMDGQPWCAMFVSWVFDKAGSPLPVIQQNAPSGGAYCPFFEAYAKKHSQWSFKPQKGDLALFHFGKKLAVHIGIVDQVHGNNFTCIEGNTSISNNDNGGAVMLRTRSISQCRGFYRPVVQPAKKGKDAYYRLIRLSMPLMQGNDVREWQKHMNYFAEYQHLEVDGYYGQQSERVCKNFQQKRGLDVDGIIGEITWNETFKPLTSI